MTATNQNITQITTVQVGSANATSLLYAVINGTTDTQLPLNVFVNSLGLTGTPTAPTAAPGTNTTQIATTSYVVTSFLTIANAAATYLTQANAASTYAPKASPTFTGTVVIPTVTLSGGTINSTSVGATTPSTGAFTTLSASSTVSGTGFSTYLASPPAIGGTAANTGAFTTLAATSGTFTNLTGVTYSSGAFFVNDTSGSGSALYFLRNSGTNEWAVYNSSSTNQFAIGRYVAGAFTDNPITIANATGVVTMADGIANSPISGSTGSFTTLAASGNDALFYQNSSAQSFASGTAATVTNWTKVSDRVNANFVAATGVFTAPATGFYQVSAQLFWTSIANVVGTVAEVSVVANGVTIATGGIVQSSTSSIQNISSVSAIASVSSGQTIVIQGFQNVGSARTLGGVAALSFVSINRIP